jgi:hypothetical protein
METMDGGVPGNTAFRELAEVGQESVEALARYGDEGAAMAEVIAERSDEVLDVLDGGVVVVRPGAAQDFAEDLLSNLRALRGGDIRVYYSATSGAVYTSAPTAKALDALEQLKAIVASGRMSGDDVDQLVEIIAAESMRGSGNRLVLGKYGGDRALYIHDALDNSGTFFDTGDVVYRQLNDMGLDWDVNAAALRQQVEAGMPVEFSLRGMGPEEAISEFGAIEALAGGTLEDARAILRLGPDDATPPRLLEVQWMLNAGYLPEIGDLANGVIRWNKK